MSVLKKLMKMQINELLTENKKIDLEQFLIKLREMNQKDLNEKILWKNLFIVLNMQFIYLLLFKRKNVEKMLKK